MLGQDLALAASCMTPETVCCPRSVRRRVPQEPAELSEPTQNTENGGSNFFRVHVCTLAPCWTDPPQRVSVSNCVLNSARLLLLFLTRARRAPYLNICQKVAHHDKHAPAAVCPLHGGKKLRGNPVTQHFSVRAPRTTGLHRENA